MGVGAGVRARVRIRVGVRARGIARARARARVRVRASPNHLPHDERAVLGDLQPPLQVGQRDGALLRRAW